MTREQLEAERNYLLRWLGGFDAELKGLSADNLSVFAVTGRGPRPRDYPYDQSDLGRCERAYKAMPPHLQERALPLLEQWRERVRVAAADLGSGS